jgi:hypothetical protein
MQANPECHAGKWENRENEQIPNSNQTLLTVSWCRGRLDADCGLARGPVAKGDETQVLQAFCSDTETVYCGILWSLTGNWGDEGEFEKKDSLWGLGERNRLLLTAAVLSLVHHGLLRDGDHSLREFRVRPGWEKPVKNVSSQHLYLYCHGTLLAKSCKSPLATVNSPFAAKFPHWSESHGMCLIATWESFKTPKITPPDGSSGS